MFTQADGAASVAISAAGTNVQLFQRGIEVHGGVTYTATFTASNTAGRDVRVRLMDHTTFADLGLDVVVDLTEEPQRFSIDFTVPAGLDSTNARLTFWMGPFDAPGTTYTYDAVGIDEVCGVTNLVP